MKLHELSPAEGSNKKSFRKGRGTGSGNGKTAGKGHKGQNDGRGFQQFQEKIQNSHNYAFPSLLN